jgi:radical SAM protein with 4Fe4S-binding SPASM domain
MCGRTAVDFKNTYFNIDWMGKINHILNYTEEVTLMGWGEPMVHPQFREILGYLNHFPVRKYICTNGTLLDKYREDLFKAKLDILAVSLDGAYPPTNDRIRCGSSLEKVTASLRRIVRERGELGVGYPYINFVFTAMKSNIAELPHMVSLAHEIGIEEVKVVYLTVMSEDLLKESLYDRADCVAQEFKEAEDVAKELGIALKLPYIQNEDPAVSRMHRDCYVPWRDLFIGSDGYVRPCMSCAKKLISIQNGTFDDIWNSEQFQNLREGINDPWMMPSECKRCYQSSIANWNLKQSWVQVGEQFAPAWEKEQ